MHLGEPSRNYPDSRKTARCRRRPGSAPIGTKAKAAASSRRAKGGALLPPHAMHDACLASIAGTSATRRSRLRIFAGSGRACRARPDIRAVRSRNDAAASAAAPADPSQRPRKPEMLDSVRRLRAVARLEVGDEVQLAAVIAPMAGPAQSDHAQRVVAPAEASRDEMCRVDPRRAVAHQARVPGDLRPLCGRCGRERAALERRGAFQRRAAIQRSPAAQRRTASHPRASHEACASSSRAVGSSSQSTSR